MELLNNLTRKEIVNIFADFLVKKFGHNSKFEVIDVGNFLVIMGETDRKDFIDLNNVKSEFLNLIKTNDFNTIDLIKYNPNLSYIPIWNSYYNTIRPIFNESSISSLLNGADGGLSLSVKSEFPHGYGMNQGRFDYYFGEYVSNHIFNMTNSDSIRIYFNENEKVIEDFRLKLELNGSLLPTSFVWDLLMDVFYTRDNIEEISKLIYGYDITYDSLDLLGNRPWLIKNKIPDLLPI